MKAARNIVIAISITFVIALVGVLSGCATDMYGNKVPDGAAVYHYQKTANSCELRVTSARNPTGLSANVNGDTCSVHVETAIDPDKKAQLEALELAKTVVKKLVR